jgi:hypothetical protein
MLHFMRIRHEDEMAAQALASAAIPQSLRFQPDARLTRQQYVALYRTVAATLDDEMLGLWSRPIQGGTLTKRDKIQRQQETDITVTEGANCSDI